jgi:hypothetical protein
MDPAVHARCVGLEEHLDRAQVQGTPPSSSFATVVPRGTVAACAAPSVPRSLWSHVSHHDTGLDLVLDVLDHRFLDP